MSAAHRKGDIGLLAVLLVSMCFCTAGAAQENTMAEKVSISESGRVSKVCSESEMEVIEPDFSGANSIVSQSRKRVSSASASIWRNCLHRTASPIWRSW